MSSVHDGEVVLEGTWLYAGELPSPIVIIRRDTCYGSGDYEDPPEIGDDQQVETFEVRYANPSDPTVFNAGGGQYRSLEEARAAAESKCGPTTRWLAQPR